MISNREEILAFIEAHYEADFILCEIAMPKELDAVLDSVGLSFADTLLSLIDKRGITDAEAYKRSLVSRKTFSKIRCDRAYRPGRDTALSFCVGLHLSIDEATALLSTVGFALSHSDRRDLVIEYYLTTGKYKDINEVNEMLFELCEETLGV